MAEGFDPSFSPDGGHLAYSRGVLGASDIEVLDLEEVWIIRADGTERPRFLARGGWPNWSGDSKRLYYHNRLDNMVYSIYSSKRRPVH